jgi:predicted dithiol-disulfide oxidoreductase (DUF899 family)
MTRHRIGTHEEWKAARERLLEREKAHTRLGDELAQARRELPWVPVERDYSFETESGRRSLGDLFDGRSQLLIYHFMFGPSYEAGCPTCSSMADTFDGAVAHLRARDATFICVSSAPIEKLAAYKRRMGWDFEWASAPDFSADFGFVQTEDEVREWIEPALENGPPILAHNAAASGTDPIAYVSEVFGFTSFASDDGAIYHTYSTTGRGIEFLMGYYGILDRAPNGRDEGDAWQTWIRRHDEYGTE